VAARTPLVKRACVIAASEVLMAASSIFKTKRQEAKAAADAAAAAAADACAVCEKLYGDDPEKDDLWIACDRCNRWYHGACVDLTQVTLHRHARRQAEIQYSLGAFGLLSNGIRE